MIKFAMGVVIGAVMAVGAMHTLYATDGVAFGETMQRTEQAKRIADQAVTKARTEAKRAAKAYAEGR